jgi:MFS transporter, FHS family, glucose/mannose:H+ symporter
MAYNPKVIFWAACLGMLLFGIGLITLGSVATPLIEKFHLTQLNAGTLFFILPFGILAGSLVFGALCDTYGYKPVLAVSCLCMFAGFQGIAYSSSLPLLRICIFLFGLAGGAINGATNAVVADISSENKGANLSLLGVFFALGSISVPSILGLLQKTFSFEQIISSIGFLTVIACILYLLIKFPQPKQGSGISLKKMSGLIKDSFLLLVAFYLFLVSSLEGIINNWTTIYLEKHLSVPHENSLFALSSYVIGMAVMRIFLGSVFRKVNTRIIVFGCLGILLTGCVLLALSNTYYFSVTALVTMGVGLAAGFPVMLGLVGGKYADVSATAFSFVLVIALAGNMLVNFLMGAVAERYGIHHFTTIAISAVILMFLLAAGILKSKK